VKDYAEDRLAERIMHYVKGFNDMMRTEAGEDNG